MSDKVKNNFQALVQKKPSILTEEGAKAPAKPNPKKATKARKSARPKIKEEPELVAYRRKPEAERLTERAQTLFTKSEMQTLKRNAKGKGVSISNHIRAILKKAGEL